MANNQPGALFCKGPACPQLSSSALEGQLQPIWTYLPALVQPQAASQRFLEPRTSRCSITQRNGHMFAASHDCLPCQATAAGPQRQSCVHLQVFQSCALVRDTVGLSNSGISSAVAKVCLPQVLSPTSRSASHCQVVSMFDCRTCTESSGSMEPQQWLDTSEGSYRLIGRQTCGL